MQGALCLNCCRHESNTLHWRITTARHLGQEENAILSTTTPPPPPPPTLVDTYTQTSSYDLHTHDAHTVHADLHAFTNADTYIDMDAHTDTHSKYLSHMHTQIDEDTAY